MHAIENAFIYCYHTIGEIFYRPRLLFVLFLFFIESLLAAVLALALTTLIIRYLDLDYYGLFAIGAVMALFLFVFYFLYQLLKARAIATHQAPVDHRGQWAKLFTLGWPVLSFTFQHKIAWRKPPRGIQRWQIGKHLMLPLMVKYQRTYGQAYPLLQQLKSTKPLRYDPRLVAVKPLTFVFCAVAVLFGIALGTWLGFSTASSIVVSFVRRVQAVGLALLVFLAITWLPLALSAVKLGLYHADLLTAELAEQQDYLPELLTKALGSRP